MGVPDHLHLDVAGGGQVPLQEDLVRAERGRRLPLRRRHGVDQLAGPAHEPHPPAAASGGRLDQERVADGRRGAGKLVGGRPGRHDGAGQHGHAGAGDNLLRPRLVAHHAHRLGRRADPR